MRYLVGLTFIALLAPATARGQDAPEKVLSAGTQIYLRWDGIDAHKEAQAKTALGKLLAGDTGKFLVGLSAQVQEGLGTLLTVEQLLGGAAPEKLQQMKADAEEAAKVLPLLGQTGFILAGELRGLEPPDADVTLIAPNAGAKSKQLFGAIRLIVNLSKGKIKEHKQGDRLISYVEPTNDLPVYLTWWQEGAHAVVSLSTDRPEAQARRLADPQRPRLSENPLFKRIAGFKGFETSARAFLDIEALLQKASTRGPEVKKLLDELGLNSLKSLVMYSGFAGEAERGLLELEMPGPKKGLAGLFRGKAFTLADLPPLPPDVISFNMTAVDLGQLYDVALEAAESVTRVVAPNQAEVVKSARTLVNLALGLDLRKDLLDALDDKFVSYNAPSEGPFQLGQVVLLKVKDGDKVKESIEQIIKALARLAGGEVMLKKHTFQGVEVREVRIKQQGFFFMPSYAVHKGWLAVALFPQPVHGYIARANGQLRGWKVSPRVQALFDEMPKEVVSISYSDPRPSIRQIMSLGPMIGGLVMSFNPEMSFQIASIPTSQEMTRHLFPNVSVASADDKSVRMESRSSLPLPFDVAGLDTYGVLILFTFAARGIF